MPMAHPAWVDFDRAQLDQRAAWVSPWPSTPLLVVGSSLSVLIALAARATVSVKPDRSTRAALFIQPHKPLLTTRAPDKVQGSGMGPRQETQLPQSSTINANTQDQDPGVAKCQG
jgi:hypothetical protein